MRKVPGIPGPYWSFFYGYDYKEPMHVHVRCDRQQAKFWLAPVALAWNHGLSARELNDIRRLIVEHEQASSRRGMSTAAAVGRTRRYL